MAVLRPSPVFLRPSSAFLRPSSVLLLSCVLLAGASYVRREDVFSAGPLSETPAPSRLSCAALCDRTTGCSGFTFNGNGSCQLFGNVSSNLNSTSDHFQIQYLAVLVAPCPEEWLLYRNSCYLRPIPSIKPTWEEARAACRDNGSDLASLNDENEEIWMMEHPSRPPTAEFIGVRTEDGELVNVDGTIPLYEPSLKNDLNPNTSCLYVRGSDLPSPFGVRSCSDTRVGFICESPHRCRPGRSPCPADWLALDDYCYLYVTNVKTWQDADDYCAGLQPGARLSPVINMGTWRILHHNLGLRGITFVGISDRDSEGSFQSIDGSAWSVTWREGQPDNFGNREDCVWLSEDLANDLPCSERHRFICRAPRSLC